MRSVVTEAKYTKRYNTGEYEFEELTLSAVVDEKESGTEVLIELKNQIHAAFTGAEVAKPEEGKQPEAKPSKKKKEEKKDVKSKTNPSDDEDESAEDSESEDSGDDAESSEDDEGADDEAGDDSDDSSDDSEDGDKEEDAEEESPKPSKSGKQSSGGKGKKTYSKKPQDYNRSIEQHKGLFSSVLGLVAPDWKKTDESKKKAKEASEKLEGTPFLDENGEVLESFKAEVKKLMSAKKK